MGATTIIAMIPARIGSTRLKSKNLALINGKPLISYAIEAAKNSGVFNKVIINSDDTVFDEISKRYDAEFYLRPTDLGTSTTKSDSVVYDFMLKHPSDITAWVNPTSPLQTEDEIREIVEHFQREQLDTLITVKNEQTHCVYDSNPVNFTMDEIFAQTQDLKPVQPFVYSVMMWRNAIFMETFKKQGHAFFCGKIGYYPVSKATGIIIKTKEDLMLADYMAKAQQLKGAYEVTYDKVIEKTEKK